MTGRSVESTGFDGSRLQSKLDAGKTVITAELSPPASMELDAFLARARSLEGLADAINLTDSAGARAAIPSLIAAAKLIEIGVEPVLQMTCRDRNRIALQADLMAAGALGISNILILRGDDPASGDQPDAVPVFDLDARALLQTAVGLRDDNMLPSGRSVAGSARFFLGAADIPIDPPPDWSPERMLAKISAGARFIQTQINLDVAMVGRYAAALAANRFAEQVHLIAGIAVPASAKSARWMRDKLFGVVVPDAVIDRLESASDEREEGIQIAAELIRELSDTSGVAGVHVMAPLDERAISAAIMLSGRTDT